MTFRDPQPGLLHEKSGCPFSPGDRAGLAERNAIRSCFGLALFVALALSPVVSLAETMPAGTAAGSFNAKDLCGKWKVENPEGYSSSGDYAYEGWVIVVKDSDDRTVLIKATKPEWERQAEKLQNLDTHSAFNLRLDKMEGAHGPYHYY